MRKLFWQGLKIISLLVFALIIFKSPALAEEKKIEFYWKQGCQYCEKEAKFLDKLQKEQTDVKIDRFQVDFKDNAERLVKRSQEMDFKAISVPITIIGQNVIIGFESEESTGNLIKQALEKPNDKSVTETTTCAFDAKECKSESKEIDVPFIGKINPYRFSLPVLTIILGLADGFNPCAMWALVALLGLLLSFNSQKKLVIVGGSFIFFSYMIYLVFMAAWLNAFLYLGYIKTIQMIIGGLGIIVGLNYIRDFLRTDPATCKIVKPDSKRGIIALAKKFVNHNFLPVAIIGVALLAIAVNTIEALCSIGIPTIYTKILADSGISKSGYYGYLGLYNIFYMFDDLIVFGAAVLTRKIVHPSPKVGYWSKLIGGIAVIILGLIFIFKPELMSL